MSTSTSVPCLRIQIDEDGHTVATLDGEAYGAAGEGHPRRRESVRRIVDAAQAELGTLRVEIVEADGSSYSDVLLADDTAPDAEAPADEEAGGFLPGEPVAIALIVREHTASDTGAVALHLPASVTAGHRGNSSCSGVRPAR